MKFGIPLLLGFLILLPDDSIASEPICESFVNGESTDKTKIQDWCDGLSNKCCQGTDACANWSADATYNLCEGSCNGDSACSLLAQNAQEKAKIFINKDACAGFGNVQTKTCMGLAQDSDKLVSLIVKDGSCFGDRACTQLAGDLQDLENLDVEVDSCVGERACQDAFRAATRLTTLTIPERSCLSEDSCYQFAEKAENLVSVSMDTGVCNGYASCEAFAKEAGSSSGNNFESITLESGACSRYASCYYLAASAHKLETLFIGNDTCAGFQSCYSLAQNTNELEHLMLMDNACQNENSCYHLAQDARNLIDLNIGTSSCSSSNSCSRLAKEVSALILLSIGSNSCLEHKGCEKVATISTAKFLTIGNDACNGFNQCYEAGLGKDAININIPDGQCSSDEDGAFSCYRCVSALPTDCYDDPSYFHPRIPQWKCQTFVNLDCLILRPFFTAIEFEEMLHNCPKACDFPCDYTLPPTEDHNNEEPTISPTSSPTHSPSLKTSSNTDLMLDLSSACCALPDDGACKVTENSSYTNCACYPLEYNFRLNLLDLTRACDYTYENGVITDNKGQGPNPIPPGIANLDLLGGGNPAAFEYVGCSTISDITPTQIELVDIEEIGPDDIILKSDFFFAFLQHDSTITYESITATDPDAIVKTFKFYMGLNGVDETGAEAKQDFFFEIRYSNLCNAIPYTEKDFAGYLNFDASVVPDYDLCFTTPSPTISPSKTPSMQPSVEPTKKSKSEKSDKKEKNKKQKSEKSDKKKNKFRKLL